LAAVIRLSSQYNQPPLEEIKAVSVGKRSHDEGTPTQRTRLTVPTTQTAEMIRHCIQIIPIWGYLGARVIWWVNLHAPAIDAGWERWGHVVGQVEAFERKVDVLFYLVSERALEREALKVDEQNWR